MVQHEIADPGRAGTVELDRGNLATVGGKEVDTDDRQPRTVRQRRLDSI